MGLGISVSSKSLKMIHIQSIFVLELHLLCRVSWFVMPAELNPCCEAEFVHPHCSWWIQRLLPWVWLVLTWLQMIFAVFQKFSVWSAESLAFLVILRRAIEDSSKNSIVQSVFDRLMILCGVSQATWSRVSQFSVQTKKRRIELNTTHLKLLLL